MTEVYHSDNQLDKELSTKYGYIPAQYPPTTHIYRTNQEQVGTNISTELYTLFYDKKIDYRDIFDEQISTQLEETIGRVFAIIYIGTKRVLHHQTDPLNYDPSKNGIEMVDLFKYIKDPNDLENENNSGYVQVSYYYADYSDDWTHYHEEIALSKIGSIQEDEYGYVEERAKVDKN